MKALRYFLASQILICTVAVGQAQDSVLSDPVKRNHFCNDHFPALDQFQQCHDMWPYEEGGTTNPDSDWMGCEQSSTTAGRLDESKMAECLLQDMDT